MPAKSAKQMRYILAMRNKYKTRAKAPKDKKWLFNKDWSIKTFSDWNKNR